MTVDADTPQQQWKQQVADYAQAVNRYVETGLRDGWENMGDGPPVPDMEALLPVFHQALREINAGHADAGQRQRFREQWPYTCDPLSSLLKGRSRIISTMVLLDDGSLLARIGASWEGGTVVHIREDEVTEVPGVLFVGQSRNRRFFAMADADAIRLSDGWGGPETAKYAWPTGLEDLPQQEGRAAPAPWETPFAITQLVPFNDGRRVLLVSDLGIYLLAPDATRRVLLPEETYLADGLAHGDALAELLHQDMSHAAVSPDDRWIAAGHQSSMHHVFDAELNEIAEIGPEGEYPHFTMFNTRGDQVIFNACHFYNGGTIAVAVADFPGLKTDFYSGDPRTPVVEGGARIYAGVHHGDEYIIGDADGYLRAFDEAGRPRWQHFIGGTVSELAISADGSTLAAGTCAGFVSLIRLHADAPDPMQIGTGPQVEYRRWVFWKGEDKPLLW